MAYEAVRYLVADGIATLTLSRPDKLNAVNGQMIREFLDVLSRADADDDVRALIVTGEGRGFCSGADLSRGEGSFIDPASRALEEAGATVDYASEEVRDPSGDIAMALYNFRKPVIGAINGPCAGLGATMSLPMDIRLASETARFGFVFARRGMVPECASSFFLPRLVGISTALEWCYTGRMVSAEEALQAGLVSRVLPPEELIPAAKAIAREIADSSAPVSVALVRQMLWRGMSLDHPMDAYRVESWGTFVRSRSEDAAEGIRAFMEKRPPDFPQKVSRDMPEYYPWWDEPEYS